MKTMWAPWRMEYILADKEGGCVFCDGLLKNDDLTLYKGNDTMVMMNKFPYINGHLLVAPVQHLSALDQLGKRRMGELLATVERSVDILGKVAGAGVEEHLHFHIVPRWVGDTNALTVFADVRVIPEHIRATYENLRPHFETLNLNLAD
jgi:ATP adenylyltransferase